MTKELFKWLKENQTLLQETNRVDVIMKSMPRNLIMEFLAYIRQSSNLNNSVVWDDKANSNKCYQIHTLDLEENRLIAERMLSKIYPQFASEMYATNFNTWIYFKSLKECVDFMIAYYINDYAGIEIYPYPVTFTLYPELNLKEINTDYGKCYVTSVGYAQLNK